MNPFANNQVLKTAATATKAMFTTSTVLMERAEQVIDNMGSAAVHATAALDDLAENMHDATTMAKIDDMTQRRLSYIKKYENEPAMPAALAALCQTN